MYTAHVHSLGPGQRSAAPLLRPVFLLGLELPDALPRKPSGTQRALAFESCLKFVWVPKASRQLPKISRGFPKVSCGGDARHG